MIVDPVVAWGASPGDEATRLANLFEQALRTQLGLDFELASQTPQPNRIHQLCSIKSRR